jgi:hypothetical protein
MKNFDVDENTSWLYLCSLTLATFGEKVKSGEELSKGLIL